MTQTLIVGCGYLGQRLAPSLPQTHLSGIIRTHHKTLKRLGIEPLAWDLDQPGGYPKLPLETEVYYFLAPPSQGQTDTRLAHFLTHQTQLRKILLLSTTGVYGDCLGAWVDETQPPKPSVDRAFRRLHAEQSLIQHCQTHAIPYNIIRVPGIYGPNKLPIARIQARKPMVCDAESPFSNRIHVDDLTRLCLTVMQHAPSGEVYNAADGHPTTMCDYFHRVAEHCGLQPPTEITLAQAQHQVSAGMLSYLQESRRICIDKITHQLDFHCRYPTLAHGLHQCHHDALKTD